MMPLKVKLIPEASERLEEVLTVAARLIARDGFEKASIRAISEEASLSQAGLYHYFRGKEHLLYLIQKNTFNALKNLLITRLDPNHSPEERLKTLIKNHLEFFITYMDALRVCAYEYTKLTGDYFDEVSEIRRDYFNIGHKIVQEVLNKNRAIWVKKSSSKHLTLYLFGALNWIHTWYNTERKADIATMTEELANMILYGLSGHENRRSNDN